jgi:predicted anti-sigma-YlaC factor YlaD
LNSRSARQCLTDNEIEDFLFQRLSGTTREVIEEHLLVCPQCLDRVEAEEEFVGTMRAAARTMESEQLERAFHATEPASKPARTWHWRRWGLALSFAGALLAIVAVVQFRPSAPVSETEIALQLSRDSGGLTAEAGASQPLRLTPDLSGLPDSSALSWSIVDRSGQAIAQGQLAGAAGIKLPRGLTAGGYWVRLQGPGGELVREFALRVR